MALLLQKPSKPIYVVLNPSFKIFSSLFNIVCEEVSLQLQMELTDLQCSEDPPEL